MCSYCIADITSYIWEVRRGHAHSVLFCTMGSRRMLSPHCGTLYTLSAMQHTPPKAKDAMEKVSEPVAKLSFLNNFFRLFHLLLVMVGCCQSPCSVVFLEQEKQPY